MPKLVKNWNFKLLFGPKGETALLTIRTEAEKISYQFINKWKNRTDWQEKPAVLREALDEYEAWARNFGANSVEDYYWGLRQTQDQTSPAIKAKTNQAEEQSQKIGNDIQFFTLRLAKVAPAKQKEFLANPKLTKYHHFLEQLFAEAKYILSEPEEKILSLDSAPAYRFWTRMTESFLAGETRTVVVNSKKETKNYEELLTLCSHENKPTRDRAAAAFNEIVAEYATVAEAELNAILAHKKTTDELRGFTRPDAARHLSDDIDSATVDALLSAVEKNFSLPARFYKLKAKLLGQPHLAYHERNVPVGKIDKEIAYPAAVTLVRQVFGRLDPEFLAIYDRFLAAGQFDVFPAKGKAGGAYCASGLLSSPTYINLNYTNRLNDILTIAHEVGHGINNELQRPVRHSLDFGTPLATAEVASTFMEDFVLEEILRTEKSEHAKLAITLTKLNADMSTIFRQVACYRFEQALHTAFRAKGYLSSAEIGKLFQKHMKAYMGPAVDQSAGSENWWVYWGHIRNFFYVYSYASGLLISKALQAKVKAEPRFIAQVRDFLAAGESASPKTVFAKLGLNISDPKFWATGLTEIAHSLTEAEKLAKKLNYRI
ncbi:MAG: M3 family oligoendopeptidase [Candidatus Vogelbacteria bacterium]|nr:M3 family oligoendopeptidase [Candidatus Vogelbacteria bacterium]